MAQHIQFKGIKRVLSSNTAYTQTDSFLYFVRESAQATSGDIWFMGHHYGHFGEHDLDAINTALEGFLTGQGEAGYKNVKEYIDEAVSAITSGMTTSVELDPDAFSGLTIEDKSATPNVKDYVINLQNVAREDLLEKEIQDREDADEALEDKLEATAATLTDMIEAEAQEREDADDDLQEQIDELTGFTKDLQDEVDRIETAVGLSADGNYVADDGQYVSAATSVLDATAKLNDALVQEVVDRNQAIEDAIEALIGDASESGNTLGELEDRIEELSADAKEYHLVKTTTGLPETIKERYSLVDADGNVSGDTVDIPKDSHIVSIRYITDSADTHYQNLEYTYLDASGDTKVEYVDMSQLVLETEFASGVSATGGVVHGIVDPQSEDFLTVGADGFKLSGVQDAIDAAVEAEAQEREDADDAIESALTLTAQTLVEMIENAASAATTEVVEGTDAGNNLSIAESAGADGHKIYTLNLTDVASASALTQEISDREDADEELQENLKTTADTLTAMIDDLTDGLQAELDAVESSLGFDGTAYTQTEKIYISGDTVAEDIARLDVTLGSLNDNMADLADALEATAQTLSDAITAETSAREEADEALDERLDAIEESYLTGVTVNGVDASVSANTASVTIDAGDIEIGTPLSAATGSSLDFGADAKVDEVLQGIIDSLSQAVAGSYTGVTGADGSVSVARNADGLGHDLSVNVKQLALADVQAGETEIKKEEGTGKLYGVMYWIDEETE